MRFGGNIGVHAINRTSAAPMNPSQQLLQQPGALGMPGMGGLGGMAGLGSALDGLPGAPRPGVRPPNWQRAQALAQQAAQAQAQQQVSACSFAVRVQGTPGSLTIFVSTIEPQHVDWACAMHAASVI